MRKVLVHYHIFKNSGNSLDHVLKRSFDKGVKKFDVPPGQPFRSQTELGAYIAENPEFEAFSSHTITLPVPIIPDIEVIPIVFVRHPLLRLKSIYSFHTRQLPSKYLAEHSDAALDTPNIGIGKKFALVSNSLEAWVQRLLETQEGLNWLSDHQQTRFLSDSYDAGATLLDTTGSDHRLYDFDMVTENLSRVNLLGRTERFADDICRIAATLLDDGITIDISDLTPKNVTDASHDSPIEERVALVESVLSQNVLDRLHEMLQQDFQLYSLVNTRLS